MRNQLLSVAVVLSLVAGAGVQAAETRMAPIPPEKYDAAQKKAVAEFEAVRKTGISGPWIPLLRSPEIMTGARTMGDYLRYRASIGPRLTEFTILVISREWTIDFEWAIHAPNALKLGVPQETLDALADGRRPTTMTEDEAICYDFTMELLRNKRVSDATYDRALKKFGEKGVIDLVGFNGYYALLAMTFSTARIAAPDGKKMLRFPD